MMVQELVRAAGVVAAVVEVVEVVEVVVHLTAQLLEEESIQLW